ncbi:putative phenylacetone monooxygenase protein [Eutypa lata UCREL1]|uniref:Putative phenylacetone monooxygenase protein n=1 Tax=Eutypa lata (strain UCR-EL1) TaxID=1287681 RepID=M7SLG6_EUTLA|nr:putative phenylacetone monooxygenase protein [Eutypa lata UCREL1]
MAAAVIAKYAEERDKRLNLRPDGLKQYTNVHLSEKYSDLGKDPWIDYDALAQEEPSLKDGDRIKFLITGGGHSGLLYAHRLIEAGFKSDDIRIIDTAGGFGGTWYWNRYPGLMCDVESYIYLPLLEETGFVPSYKYSPGYEIRKNAEKIAEIDNLKALFSTKVDSLEWDEEKGEWIVKMTRNFGPRHGSHGLTVRAQFVLTAGGIFPDPKVPNVPGYDLLRSQKHIFHTSRWDWDYTGGSERNPAMENLKDKVVAIIGTGATAVQAVPAVAKWAKRLYVFQRTPSHCGARRQRETDPKTWSEVAYKKGWQVERQDNFNSFLTNDPEPINLVNDGWTDTPGSSGTLGNPRLVTASELDEHFNRMIKLDLPQAEKVRARVDEVVKDPATAEKLKAWYPNWCKRPTFHDDYLEAFNKPNVVLVDTDGKGVERYTKDGLTANGTDYEIDVLILGTGFQAQMSALAPTSRMHAKTIGRDGRELQEKWASANYGTLIGVATNQFPNLFFNAISGFGVSFNLTSTNDVNARLVANIISQASRRARDPNKLIIEATKVGEDEYIEEVKKRALALSVIATCTPGYFSEEGSASRSHSTEGSSDSAKYAPWGGGARDFSRMVEAYKAKGDLKGFSIRG